jgi:hypothetical protein
MKVPKDIFQRKYLTAKRPDQIFRKTKICATLGKHTSNLVIITMPVRHILGSDYQAD